jgi:glucose/arabinose dehydrogenase
MRRWLISTLVVICGCTTPAEDGSTTAAVSSTSATSSSTTSTVSSSTTTTTLATTTTLVPLQSLAYREVLSVLFPVQVTARPGDETAYVVTKDGQVWALLEGQASDQPVLDISDQVSSRGERGLLSMALHPTDPSRFYLHYSDRAGDTVVSEFTFVSPNEADPASERVLLQVDQPAPNHNGGMLQFTPDGTLLLGLGDGGGADDQFDNGQNPDTLLAGLVEINVDGDPNPTKYATGLRNPWRFWIDGDLIYVGDVGQDIFEEVDVAPLGPGLNYGWSIAEGLHCFRSESCDTSGQVIPVIEVHHGDGGACSVTGGVVYRGSLIPELDGVYLYSDYCGGWLRSFRYVDGAAAEQTDWTEQVGVPGKITGFGVDGGGEVYVTTTEGVLALVPVR